MLCYDTRHLYVIFVRLNQHSNCFTITNVFPTSLEPGGSNIINNFEKVIVNSLLNYSLQRHIMFCIPICFANIYTTFETRVFSQITYICTNILTFALYECRSAVNLKSRRISKDSATLERAASTSTPKTNVCIVTDPDM